MLVCGSGDKIINEILAENTKINANFVMHLLQSPKHSYEIHWLGQISGMHHHFFSFYT